MLWDPLWIHFLQALRRKVTVEQRAACMAGRWTEGKARLPPDRCIPPARPAGRSDTRQGLCARFPLAAEPP